MMEQYILDKNTIDALIKAAAKVRENAYTPHGKYPVGAALLTKSGEIITGCNVENGSFPAGVCAEHNAVNAAVAQGHREFKVIVVLTENAGTPCGICRQVLAEHAPDATVICLDTSGKQKTYTVQELLPHGFKF